MWGKRRRRRKWAPNKHFRIHPDRRHLFGVCLFERNKKRLQRSAHCLYTRVSLFTFPPIKNFTRAGEKLRYTRFLQALLIRCSVFTGVGRRDNGNGKQKLTTHPSGAFLLSSSLQRRWSKVTVGRKLRSSPQQQQQQRRLSRFPLALCTLTITVTASHSRKRERGGFSLPSFLCSTSEAIHR